MGTRRSRSQTQTSEFFATKRCENYWGFDSNLLCVYKRDGDIAAAPEILVLL